MKLLGLTQADYLLILAAFIAVITIRQVRRHRARITEAISRMRHPLILADEDDAYADAIADDTMDIDLRPARRTYAQLQPHASPDRVPAASGLAALEATLAECAREWHYIPGTGWTAPTGLTDSLPDGDWRRDLLMAIP